MYVFIQYMVHIYIIYLIHYAVTVVLYGFFFLTHMWVLVNVYVKRKKAKIKK